MDATKSKKVAAKALTRTDMDTNPREFLHKLWEGVVENLEAEEAIERGDTRNRIQLPVTQELGELLAEMRVYALRGFDFEGAINEMMFEGRSIRMMLTDTIWDCGANRSR